jgi:hypothetical protein
MKRKTAKKPYEKPLVTRVRLSVQHNVLQSCRNETEPGMSPYVYPECHLYDLCLTDPTL